MKTIYFLKNIILFVFLSLNVRAIYISFTKVWLHWSNDLFFNFRRINISKNYIDRIPHWAITNFFMSLLLTKNTHSLVNLVALNVFQGIDNSVLELGDSHIAEVFLYGRKFLDISSNTNILNATIEFLHETKRFDERLF